LPAVTLPLALIYPLVFRLPVPPVPTVKSVTIPIAPATLLYPKYKACDPSNPCRLFAFTYPVVPDNTILLLGPTVNPVNVPTEVMFGCAAVVTVAAVVAVVALLTVPVTFPPATEFAVAANATSPDTLLPDTAFAVVALLHYLLNLVALLHCTTAFAHLHLEP
jgi:hypothetical protein